ncbi:hypothetical protein GCM10010174_31770 [Kutzneria viridogrisea]|uniref:Uncharacterized protein n=2 Tax=Kutzneria TaxID=43356 RepID=W5VXA7_9PSEU|nr:hypothetical protein [Kutzneria albida]AHH93478.1 hypothetical protein KALB_101 [Kutzneria albida DSM 43870]MBA8929136.1 hypothetical protein [Kutzneria viridogrisea]
MRLVDRHDEELLAALRAELDAPAPPVRTQLDEVLRRGRRRVRARRLVAAAGVVTVVAGVGLGSAVLRGWQGPGEAPVASPPTTVVASTGNLPSGWGPAPVTASPASPEPGAKVTCGHWVTMPDNSRAPELDGALLAKVLTETVQRVAPSAKVALTNTDWSSSLKRSDGLLGTVWIDITDSGGPGSLLTEVRAYAGAPAEAADAEAFVYGGCTTPLRKTLSNGTVLQLYGVNSDDPGHPSQALRVYTANRHLYVLVAEGFGSVNWTKDTGQLAVPKGVGRRSVPLTQQQLTQVGDYLATLG